jgi:predicted transcriptional regulator
LCGAILRESAATRVRASSDLTAVDAIATIVVAEEDSIGVAVETGTAEDAGGLTVGEEAVVADIIVDTTEDTHRNGGHN